MNQYDPVIQRLATIHSLGVDIDERLIYLIGEFGGDMDMAAEAILSLRFLTSAKHFPQTYLEPVRLVIDSPGGSDIPMFHLYDAITTCQTPVWTIGSGEVCSAAALILVAGAKRFATPNCMFMTHKGKAGLEGDDDEIEAQAALQALMSDRYWKLLERHTKLSASKWFSKSKHKGELWLNADTMLEYGVVDEIIPTTTEYPALSTKKLRTKVKIETEDEEDDDDAGDSVSS
jgi:ATP-dependent protease ClpP protease subunit